LVAGSSDSALVLGEVPVKSARDWDEAYHSFGLLHQLGLPPDHNEKLKREQEQEEQKQNPSAAGSTEATASRKPQAASGKPASPKPGNK
jgi:hypothetical protein